MIHEVALFAQRPRKYQPLPCMMSPLIIWGMKLKTLNGLILLFTVTIHTLLLFCLYIYEEYEHNLSPTCCLHELCPPRTLSSSLMPEPLR